MPRTQCFEESKDMSGTSKKALIDNVEPMCHGFADFYLDAALSSSSDAMEEPSRTQLMLFHMLFTLLHVQCCSHHQTCHWKLCQPSVCPGRTEPGTNEG